MKTFQHIQLGRVNLCSELGLSDSQGAVHFQGDKLCQGRVGFQGVEVALGSGLYGLGSSAGAQGENGVACCCGMRDEEALGSCLVVVPTMHLGTGSPVNGA